MTTPFRPQGLGAGAHTTEFWLALGQQAIVLLTLFGVFRPADMDAVNNAWVQVVVGVSGATVGGLYIWGRIMLKLRPQTQPATTDPTPQPPTSPAS